jgi:voltage-gated potassium channel
VYERFERRLTNALAGLTLRKAVGLIVGVAATLALTASVLLRLVDPAIGSWGDSLWWAVATVTTVGYGDVVPESGPGRLIAAGLMLTGLGLIPLVTSVVVSILVAQASRAAREEEVRELHEILERLDSIDGRLEGLESR